MGRHPNLGQFISEMLSVLESRTGLFIVTRIISTSGRKTPVYSRREHHMHPSVYTYTVVVEWLLLVGILNDLYVGIF